MRCTNVAFVSKCKIYLKGVNVGFRVRLCGDGVVSSGYVKTLLKILLAGIIFVPGISLFI
jgi:hypothetical protein